MVEAFINLSEFVTLLVSVNQNIVSAVTLDYSPALLNQLHSKMAGLDVDSLVVVTNSPLTKSVYEDSVEIFQYSVSSTKFHCLIANSDVQKIQQLASSLEIPTVRLVSAVGLGKLVDEPSYCVVYKNLLNYCVLGFHQGVIVSTLLTCSSGFTKDLQRFVTKTNTVHGYDLNSLPCSVHPYFTNEDQLDSSFTQALHLFAYAMTPTADTFSIDLDQIPERTRQAEEEKEKEEEEEEEEEIEVQEEEGSEFGDDDFEDDDFEGDDFEDDDFEDDDFEDEELGREDFAKEEKRLPNRKPTMQPLALGKKKSSPLTLILAVVTVLSLAAAGFTGFRWYTKNQELEKAKKEYTSAVQEAQSLNLAYNSLEQSQNTLIALQTLLKDKTVYKSLQSVQMDSQDLILTLESSKKLWDNTINPQLKTVFEVTDFSTLENPENSKKFTYLVYCKLK